MDDGDGGDGDVCDEDTGGTGDGVEVTPPLYGLMWKEEWE